MHKDINLQVIDDFFPDEMFQHLKRELNGPYFPWFSNNDTVSTSYTKKEPRILELNSKYTFDPKINLQMVHPVFNNSGWYYEEDKFFLGDILEYLMKYFDAEYLFRVKINLSPGSNDKYISGFHTDIGGMKKIWDYKTAVVYINDTNGHTILEDGSIINDKSNRLAVFHGRALHSGVKNTDNTARIVLNINFI